MSDKSNLQRAKKIQDDEWYTLYDDIQREMDFYKKHFYEKTIHCPCDGPNSNFFKFFASNFHKLYLKRLICTEYNDYGHHGRIYDSDVSVSEWRELESNGSFDAWDVGRLMLESDIIVSNPPFSLMFQFLNQVHRELKKDFLIVSPINAFTYSNIHEDIPSRKITMGASGRLHSFIRPDNTVEKLGNIVWMTTLKHGVDNPELELNTVYCPYKHLKTDDYDILNVDYVKDIPGDYFKEMAVPYTFLEKWNWNQFEIIGDCSDWNPNGFTVEGKQKFARLVIRRRRGRGY